MTEPTYRAFLSYSHRDSEAAEFWHARLQSFAIHPPFLHMPVRAGLVPATVAPIFRDRVHFDGGDELTAATYARLDDSMALVLLASPSAAASKHVNEEVRYFRWKYPGRPLVPVLVGPDDAEFNAMLPRALAFRLDADGAITDEPNEVIAVDPRPGKDGEVIGTARIIGRLVGFEGHLLGRLVEDVERRDRAARAKADLATQRDQRLRETQASQGAKLEELLAIARAGGVFSRAEQQGIAEPAIRAIVERLGGQGIARDGLVAWLDNWIEHARTELNGHTNEGAAYEAAWRKAEALFNAGRMAEVADPFMDELRREEAREAERLAERRRQRVALLEAAIDFDTRALNIDAIPARLRLIAAEDGITDPDTLGRFLHERAWECYERGLNRGDNAALLVAIGAWRAALGELTRSRVPRDWAMTQINLGNALWTIGAREGSVTRLEEAVATYRTALEEWTRCRAPLDWATAQSNLGNALQTIGARENSTTRLEEAVAAYHAALKERTRARVPLDWATTQNNLGLALRTLGTRENNSTRLTEAIVAFRLALEERTRDRVPLQWAGTQDNLGAALNTLGRREGGTSQLKEAVVAHRAALEEFTRDRAPLDWATTQNNLGNALWALGSLEGGVARLEEALSAFRAALEERTRDRVPLDWAATQNNLGNVLLALGTRENGATRLEQAVSAFRAALEERTRDRDPLGWAGTQNNLGNSLSLLGTWENSIVRLEEAVTAYRATMDEWTRERVPLDWAGVQNNLGNALQTIGAREGGNARLEEAVTAYRAALEERTRERVPLDWASSQHGLSNTLSLLAVRMRDRAKLVDALGRMRDAAEVYRQGGNSYWLPIAERRIAAFEARLAAWPPP